MANLTVYLPDDIEAQLRHAAAVEGISLSRWIATRVSELVNQSWPPAFRKLAGGFPDFPEASELRTGYGPDTPRESLD